MGRLTLAMTILALSLVLAVVAAACTEEVIKEVPVEKIVEREVVKQVPVEKIVEKEVIKEVVVEKEVVQRVVREVVATAAPLSAGLAVEQAKYGGDLKITAQGSIKTLDPGFPLPMSPTQYHCTSGNLYSGATATTFLNRR